MKISDNDAAKLLNEKVSQGVDGRVIGNERRRQRASASMAADTMLRACDHSATGSPCFLAARACGKLETRGAAGDWNHCE